MKLNLKKDTPEITELKSLFKKEEKYSDYLGATEYAIAFAYSENKKLKDKEVIALLKDLKTKYTQDIDSFTDPLAMQIMNNLSDALEENPISPHELRLVFDYILWSIDNRSWIPDTQAYVKWIAYTMELMSKDEERKYVKYIEQLAKRKAMSKQQIDSMLMRGEEVDVNEEQDVWSKKDSEFFAMPPDDKKKFLIENGTFEFELLVNYLGALREDDNFKAIDAFALEFEEKNPHFTPLYMLLADAYWEKNPLIAKQHLERALYSIEQLPEAPYGIKENMKKDIEKMMKELNS